LHDERRVRDAVMGRISRRRGLRTWQAATGRLDLGPATSASLEQAAQAG
jgi:hypothetical protein